MHSLPSHCSDCSLNACKSISRDYYEIVHAVGSLSLTGYEVVDSHHHTHSITVTVPMACDLSLCSLLRTSSKPLVYYPSILYTDWFEPFLTAIRAVDQKLQVQKWQGMTTANQLDRRTNISQNWSFRGWHKTDLWIHCSTMTAITNLCHVLHRIDVGYSCCKMCLDQVRSTIPIPLTLRCMVLCSEGVHCVHSSSSILTMDQTMTPEK